jgi:hypothetical protein
MLKGASPLGKVIFDNQSNTANLLPLPQDPPVPQFPLLLQPFGTPSVLVEQLLQLIKFYIFKKQLCFS